MAKTGRPKESFLGRSAHNRVCTFEGTNHVKMTCNECGREQGYERKYWSSIGKCRHPDKTRPAQPVKATQAPGVDKATARAISVAQAQMSPRFSNRAKRNPLPIKNPGTLSDPVLTSAAAVLLLSGRSRPNLIEEQFPGITEEADEIADYWDTFALLMKGKSCPQKAIDEALSFFERLRDHAWGRLK